LGRDRSKRFEDGSVPLASAGVITVDPPTVIVPALISPGVIVDFGARGLFSPIP